MFILPCPLLSVLRRGPWARLRCGVGIGEMNASLSPWPPGLQSCSPVALISLQGREINATRPAQVGRLGTGDLLWGYQTN